MNQLHSRTGRKSVLLAVVPLLLVLFQPQFPMVQATILVGPGDSIQQAVDDANPGETINVAAGVYTENVLVHKSLTLMGEDKYNTIVDGNGTGHVFKLTASDVNISGFTIRNGDYCGIREDQDTSTGGHSITDNVFSNNLYGIYLDETSSGSTIVGNTFHSNSMFGIKLSGSSDNNISNNYIADSTRGIMLTDTSVNNSVTGNTISETGIGIFVRFSSNNSIDQNYVSGRISGVYSLNSADINIRNNTVLECDIAIRLYGASGNNVSGNTMVQSGYGIYLISSSGNTVDSNLASNNDYGMAMYTSQSSSITQNTVSYNTYGLNMEVSSILNTIALNNMIENAMQLYQDVVGGNTWYVWNSSKQYGNHWSNYDGPDDDGDGIGNPTVPHEGVDWYPLMEPWSIVHDVAVLSVESSDDMVDQGQVVNITVVVRNEGTVNETFSVTAKYFNKIIETKTVTNLTRYESTTLLFNWNTTGVPTGFDYEIKAEAGPITGETDTTDNIFVDGTVTVETIPTPPVASFTFSPLTPYAGETVTFNASDSYDPDGTIVSYFWNFGDGTNGTGETTTHSFADTGTYPVTLNVTDNDGLTDTTLADVNVRARADVNGDGIVDIFDVGEVSAHWYPGPPEGPLGYDPDADLNNDGNVDILDMRIVSDHMGETV